jgi:hypothetical protein
VRVRHLLGRPARLRLCGGSGRGAELRAQEIGQLVQRSEIIVTVDDALVAGGRNGSLRIRKLRGIRATAESAGEEH